MSHTIHDKTDERLEQESARFLSLYMFYTGTIKSMIGLRGLALQLKVEQAGSVDELRELRQPYLDAVRRARGGEVAATLASQLDRILEP